MTRFLFLLLSFQLYASVNEDFLRLYGARLRMAEAGVSRARAELEFQRARLGRIEALVPKGATTQEELDRARADVKVAESMEVLALALQDEKDAQLEIARVKLANNEVVSLCN